MKKVAYSVLSLITVVLVVFIYFSEAVLAQDTNYCTNNNVNSLGASFDPSKCCLVEVDQVVDGNTYNPYIKTHIYRASEVASGELVFRYNLSNIPSDYWTRVLTDGNNNSLPDKLEEGWFNFDKDEANEDNSFSQCWKYLEDVSGLSVNTNQMNVSSPMDLNSCFFDNMYSNSESSNFTVALRYKHGVNDYRSICEQEITVDDETYEEATVTKPSIDIAHESVNRTFDQSDEWNITLSNANIDGSYVNLLTSIDFRLSGSLFNETSWIVDVNNNSESLLNNAEYVADEGDLRFFFSGFSIPGFISRVNDSDNFTFRLKNLSPGTHYVSVVAVYGLSVTRLGYTQINVGIQGGPTPTVTTMPSPTPNLTACEAAIAVSEEKTLTYELCQNECAGNPECELFTTLPSKKICSSVKDIDGTDRNESDDCAACISKGNAYTAFGCLPTTVEGFFKTIVFQLGLGLAGGVAFLLMLWGSFTILISQGDPQQIQRGREIIVSAIAGLLLIIFAMVIMQFLGYNLFHIPGFGPAGE